jgi:beta-glucosidase
MYSCLSVLRDGKVGVLYEAGDEGGLVFARFPLEWILEGASSPTLPEARTSTTGKFAWWPARHAAKVAEARSGGIDLLFLGDSITQGWENAGKDLWQRHFSPLRAANYGFGGDSTQHVLWRSQNGELDGITPKAVVLLVGTNNVRHSDASPGEITDGIRAILDTLIQRCPETRILLLGILPRGATPSDPMRQKCAAMNDLLPKLADGKRILFLDAGSRLLSADGTLPRDIAPDLLHLSPKGYAILAESISAELQKLLSE